MKLNLEQIKSVVQGAEEVILSDEGIEIERFSKDEREVYLTSRLEIRIHTPAGVRLNFKTDAKSIYIKLEAKFTCDRSMFSLDILKNGVLADSVKNFDDKDMTGFYSWTEYPLGEYEKTTPLGDGEKEICLVLPYTVRLYIKEISLDDASYVTPVKKEKTILFYGDSITHGYDAAHPVNTYASRISDALGCEAIVMAVGGQWFIPRLAKIKNTRSPQYVVVAYGTNDWGSGDKKTFDQNSREFIEIIKKNYPDAGIFVITPIWRKDHIKTDSEFEDIFYIGKKLFEICDSLDGVHCIDGWNLVPHKENFYGDLRLHPNDNGFKEYAKNLLSEIKKYI